MYGIKNCDTIKKARAWLESRGVDYRFHDYKTAGLERERLSVWRTLGVVVATAAVLFAVVAIGCGVEDCSAEPTH